jgi:hypothetical protein
MCKKLFTPIGIGFAAFARLMSVRWKTKVRKSCISMLTLLTMRSDSVSQSHRRVESYRALGDQYTLGNDYSFVVCSKTFSARYELFRCDLAFATEDSVLMFEAETFRDSRDSLQLGLSM